MSIKEWPEEERPREKLLRRGAATLSDAELLAIFLRTGVSGLSAVDLSRQLLQQFGSLRALLGAEQQDFCGAHGLGPAKYAQLQAVLEMGRRHLAEQLQRGEALTSPRLTRDFLQAQLRDRGEGGVRPAAARQPAQGHPVCRTFLRHPRLGERLAQRNRADRAQT